MTNQQPEGDVDLAKFWTAEQAAVAVRRSTGAIFAAARRGRLTRYRVLGRVVFVRTQVEAVFAAVEKAGT